jgi:PASTA domain
MKNLAVFLLYATLAVSLPISPSSAANSGTGVPNLVGMPLMQATQLINYQGLTLGTVTVSASSSVPFGEVISQNPPAASVVAAGSTVNIVVSTSTYLSAATSSEWIIPQVADGAGWKTGIYVTNTATTGSPVSFTINFYSQSGQPQPFALQGTGSQSTLSGTLGPSQSTVFWTQGTSNLSTEGWADFKATSTALNGVAVYESTDNKSQVNIPFAIPAGGNLMLPFDNTGGYGLGIAMVNLQTTSQTIQVTILDQNANPITTGQITLAGLGHISFILADQWPLAADRQGVVILQGAGAILGIRYSQEGAYSSESAFPVVE